MKFLKIKNSIVVAACFLLLGSCNTIYKPTMVNVPLLRDKGDVNIVFNNRHLQAAAAVSDHVGIMANGYYAKRIDEKEFRFPWYQGELGAGYFTTTDYKNIFEIYGGGGFGRVQYLDNIFDSFYLINYSRLFVQPTFGYRTDYADLAFTARFVGMKYENPTYITTINQPQPFDENLQGIDNTIYTFFEPGLTVRGGYKYVKLHVQAVTSFKLNKQPLNHENLNVNIGININIPEAFGY